MPLSRYKHVKHKPLNFERVKGFFVDYNFKSEASEEKVI